MTVIKRGKSYWVDIGFNHRRYRKRSPDNSYKGAKAYELTLRQKLTRGENIDESLEDVKPCFENFSDQWYRTYVLVNNKPSEQRQKISEYI